MTNLCTAFDGMKKVAAGPLPEVALELWSLNPAGSVLIYSDQTGKLVDLDLRGSVDEVMARLETAPEARGPGRPKLGVVAREVTLLPRHWDWLNAQPGGASVALRKLVEEARKVNKDRVRIAQETAYNFMSSLAGDLPGFEEASRALFAYDRAKFTELVAGWPTDVRDYATRLAFPDQEA